MGRRLILECGARCPCGECEGMLLPEREADPHGTDDFLICTECGYCPEEDWDHRIRDCPICRSFCYVVNQGNIVCSGCELELTAPDEMTAITAWNSIPRYAWIRDVLLAFLSLWAITNGIYWAATWQ